VTRKSTVVLTGLVLAAMGYIVYGSLARVEQTCEVCVEFNGRRNCARVAGATDQEAREAAQTTACGPIANGMDESIRCQNVQPVSVTCAS
jgi:threonine/homoserine efflux transporter RhtA